MTAINSSIGIPPIWALLVGVNTYKVNSLPDSSRRIPELRGCVNDVEALDAYLRSQLDLPAERIILLRNQQATYAAVLEAFARLLREVPAGHQVLVQFSCHGSQAPAVDPTLEPDGLDESLVLYDSRTDGVYDLLDKELGFLVDLLVQRGLNVTLIIDACHSASGTRAVLEEGVRLTSRDQRPRPVEQIYGGQQALELARTRLTDTTWVDPGDGQQSYVVLSACRSDQLARERNAERQGSMHGLFSSALLDLLRHGLPLHTTYADLHHRLRARVRSLSPDQEPQCEGDSQRAVFADGHFRRPAPVAIKRLDGDRAIIAVGAAQGLLNGSTLLAFAEPHLSDPAQALARLSVIDEGAVESVADVALLNNTAVLPIDAFLRIERYAYAPAQKVLLDGNGLAAVRAALAVAGPSRTPSPFIELVEQPNEAQFIVRRQNDALQICSATGEPLVADVAPTPNQPADESSLAALVVARLEHLARYWYAYRLRPRSALESLRAPLTVELFRLDAMHRQQTLDDEALVFVGDRLGLRLTSHHPDRLWVSIWNFTSDYEVHALLTYPAVEIQPGGRFEFRFSGPVNLPAGRAEGVELIKLFVTSSDPGDAFRVLEQPRLPLQASDSTQRVAQFREEAPTSPLGRFLADLAAGRRTLSDQGIGSWDTVERLISVLRSPTTQPPVELTATSPAQLPNGIVVSSAAPIAARVTIATLDQVTRGPASGLPRHLPQGLAAEPQLFQPLLLAPTRAGSSPALMLALEITQGSPDAITADTPLSIAVPRSLATPDERLIAVAYDGTDYVLVGMPAAPSEHSATVSVEWLPEPQLSAEAQRWLGRPALLLLYKISGQPLFDTGLRRADLREGAVVYSDLGDDSIAAGARVLLCIHGITANTRPMISNLGHWLKGELGYDELLAFDYESYGTSVRSNTTALRRELERVGIREERGIQLDIVAHSMGGLLSRTCIEMERGDRLVRRLVMAGTPNAGSPLATLTRFGFALGSMALDTASFGLTRLAAWALGYLDERGSGLRDLQPGAELTSDLKQGIRPSHIPYYAIVGTYLPEDEEARRAERLLARMLDITVDQIFREAENDLVVAASSVLTVTPPCDEQLRVACSHFGYFSSPTVRDAVRTKILGWLS